jgi:TonB family protein
MIGLALAALMLAQVATDRPPRPTTDVVESTIRCHAMHGRGGSLTGTVDITVTVGVDGRASAVATPPGPDDRAAVAAQCVGIALRYQPAIHDGQPVSEQLVLPITFPSLPTVRGELRRVVDYCHAPWNAADLREGTGDPMAKVGSVDMVARVGTNGKIREYQLPAGVLPWMADAVKCVADRLDFYPAVLRTTLAESWVVLPLDFNLTDEQHFDAEVIPPSVRSDNAAILAVYRKCYPAGHAGEARINYRITISRGGRAYRVELLESSGDPALDEAGRCILRNLAFTAARRDLRPVEATLNWPILVRPPG